MMLSFCFVLFCFGLVFFWLGVFFLFYGILVFDLFFPVFFFDELKFSFLVDYISLFFTSFVFTISGSVFIYSKYYFSIVDPLKILFTYELHRFFFLLFFFVVSMFLLIFSNNFFVIMLGWDGLGVISFLLVIYYGDSFSLNSGIITIFFNRLGDCFFLLSFLLIGYFGFGFFSIGFFNGFLLLFFFVLGCFTKSAQMPFSSWLPKAMAAPTPVSSLVHSSTLVTAGVYLLIRFNYLLVNLFFYIMVVSVFTMFLGSLIALYEVDFKKIVAMSTMSQLGFMVFSVSLGEWIICFFHMVFHAFFKSLLFLVVGSFMMFLSGDQDSRLFGGFFLSFFCKVGIFFGCLNLFGFPFTMGFFSKDLLLMFSFSLYGLVCCLFLLSCAMTIMYGVRLIYMSVFSFPFFNCIGMVNEDKYLVLPLLFIMSFGIFIGDFFFNVMFNFFVFFSFIEVFYGCILFLLSALFFFMFKKFYSYNYFFFLSSMGNLNFLFSKLSFMFINHGFYFFDMVWLNYLSGTFFLGDIFYVFYKNFLLKSFFSISFFYLVLLLILLFCFFIF